MTDEPDADAPEADPLAPWTSPYGPAAAANSSAAAAPTVEPPAAVSPAAVSPATVSPATVPPIVPPAPPLAPPAAGAGRYSQPPPAPYSPHTNSSAPGRQSLPYSTAPVQRTPTALGLLSMIFGILGLALSCCYGFGFPFAIAGVVMGHISRSRQGSARGMAVAGLVTGYIGAAISALWIVYSITGQFGL